MAVRRHRIRLAEAMTVAALLVAPLALGAQAWAAGSAIKARLYSPNAAEEVTGTLTLDGYNLSGHLIGNEIDVTVSGEVKAGGVHVEVLGRILPGCSLNRQSMNGAADNTGINTSVELAFQCPTRANSYGGGADYLFRLDLALPSPHLQIPGDPGEDAATSPGMSGKINGDPA